MAPRSEQRGSSGDTVTIDVLGCAIICMTLTAGWVFRDDIAAFVGPWLHAPQVVASASQAAAPGSGVPHVGTASARPREQPAAALNLAPTPPHHEPESNLVALPPPPLPAIYRGTRTGDTASASHRANGQFVFDAQVNGTSMPMVFDTGASLVALREEDASRAGIDLDTLNYSVRVKTANGTAFVAPIVIATLNVGSITRTNVRALVAKRGALTVNLLGQSFLKTMAGYAMDGDRLVLRGE
jgi:clan AA aspartic protease (TIGR02281 family)